MKTAYFMRKSDGSLFTVRQVQFAAKPNRSRVQVFLSNDPDQWHPGILNRLGLVRVLATPKPQLDERFYTMDGAHAEPGGESGWRQAWKVEPRYKDTASLRAALINEIKAKRDRVIESGVELHGLKIRTDAEGRSSLALMLANNIKTRQFNSGPLSKALTPAQIKDIAKAVDDHVQGAHDRAAALIGQVKESTAPADVDIDSGW